MKSVSRYLKQCVFILAPVLLKAQEQTQRVIISQVNIITMADSLLLYNQSVVIKDGKLQAILPAGQVKYRKGDRVINGKNKYLMPALFESHCHMSAANASFLQDFLDYGITTIRIPAGNETIRAWRDLINAHLLTGPDLYVAAPLIDGNPPAWADQHHGPVITNIDSVEYFINKLIEKDRYDLIKVYQRLEPAVYQKILQVCADKKIKVSGHIPIKLAKDSMLSVNTGVIEHLSGYPRMLFAEKDFTPKIKRQVYDGSMDQLASSNPDLSLLDSITKKTAILNILNCPTQVMYELKIDSIAISRIKSEENIKKYPGIFSWWNAVHRTPDSSYVKYVELRRAIIRSLHQNNAKLLAGTDSPNPWLIPGLSLHQELQYLVKAGLTNYHALLTATVNPAEYLGLQNKKGKILPGMDADLILLEKNPLADVCNTLTIVEVFKSGQPVKRKNK